MDFRKQSDQNDEQIEYINTYVRNDQNKGMNGDYKVGQKRQREDPFNQSQGNQNQVKFTCPCSDEISDLTKLSEHKNTCIEMQSQYGLLYDSWNAIVENAVAEDNLDEWRNMRAFYEFYRGKFMDGIQMVRENKRRKVAVQQTGHINGINGDKKVQEVQAVIENNHNFDIPMDQGQDAGLACIGCGQTFNDHQFDQVIFLEKCCHVACKKCLQEKIHASYPDVVCPKDDCDMLMDDFEIRQIISQEDYEKLQSNIMNKVLESDKNLVRCKCGNVIELMQGKINYDIKNDDGKKLNKTAAKHMSQYRIRCPECGNNFCTQCKVEPYHLGKTCAQYEKEKNSKKCKFCGANLKSDKTNYCSKRQCKNESRKCCSQFLECGHPCYGYNNEQEHPPCLHEECVAKDEQLTLGENADSFCVICYVQGLGEKSVIQLGCKHIFHMDCIRTRLNKRWDGLAISLKYAMCPSCNQWMTAPGHQWLEQLVDQAKQTEQKILEKCLQRAKHEGLDLDERIKDPKSEYFGNLEKFAFDHLNYYECYECKDPYFGGHRQCGAGAAGANQEAQNNNEEQEEDKKEENLRPEEEEMKEQLQHKPEQLICPKCASLVLKGADYGKTNCKKHNDQYIDYKCRFCCSVALYFCFGTHHFCDPCHRKAWEIRNKTEKDLPQCKGKDHCNLKIDHPPNGHEYALGCGLCREIKLNLKEEENQEINDF